MRREKRKRRRRRPGGLARVWELVPLLGFIKYLACRSVIWTALGPGLLRFSGLGRRRIPGVGRDVIDLGRVFASDTAEDA